MKKSSIIICLSILGYIFSISTTDNTLFDCEYGKECVVDMKSFTEGYIPDRTNLYFRIPINTKNNNAVTVKLLNNEYYPNMFIIIPKSQLMRKQSVKEDHQIGFIRILKKKAKCIQNIYILLMIITADNMLL